MSPRLSDVVASMYLIKYPIAIAVQYRTGRAHLVEEGRPECGSPLASSAELLRLEEGTNIRWCYSCIGNAIERMETE